MTAARTSEGASSLTKDLRRRLATFEPATGAPEWMPSVLLARMVSLPTTRRAWRKGVGQSAQRALLIRAGAGRTRDYDAVSQTARALAALLRREPILFDVALQATFEYHGERRRTLSDEALLELSRDPAAFVEDHPECPGEYAVAVAYALGAGTEDDLARIAELLAARLEDPAPDLDAERHRIQGLEDLVNALTRDVKERDRRLRAAEKEAQGLNDALRELRVVAQRAGDIDDELALARARVAEDAQTIAALRGELDAGRADRDRLAGAEARASDAERLRADVEQLRAERDGERELRLTAQAETERIAEELACAPQAELLPVASPSALLAALAPALGRALTLAGARIEAGTALPEDRKLLRLTTLFAELVDTTEAATDPVNAPRRRRVIRPAHPFTVRALGGAEEIGGSAFLVETDTGHSVLLDAGQRVKGEYGDPEAQPFHFRVPTDHLAAVLVTHAHIDHVGSLPTVVRAVETASESELPVWMTAPTRRLAEIMLGDSARIQRAREERLGLADTDYAADSMHAAYTRHDAEELLERARTAQRGAKFRIGDTSLLARYLPVAHVLGSCAIHLTEEQSGATLLYTGDLGPVTDPQATLPQWGFDELEPADVVIMESTYGAADAALAEGRRSLHGRERARQLLIDHARRTVGEGGFLLLPSFSLGRAQELVKLIDDHRGRELPDAPFYIAGMGHRVMDVYDEYSRPQNGGWGTVGAFPAVRSPTEWLHAGGSFDDAVAQIVADEAPGYVIASPALLSGGWSRAFLRRLAGDPRSGVVFTGYLPRSAGGIPGIRRLRTGDTLRLGDEACTIRCLWEKISLSAHAPTRDLHAFAERMTRGRERTAFGVVHGDPASQRELAGWIGETLRDEGATAHSLQRQAAWSPDLAA